MTNEQKIVNVWLDENKIDMVLNYALTLSENDKEVFADWLIETLQQTQAVEIRNTTAIVLGDLHCNKAVEPLRELIHNPELENQRGSLIYALENLDIADKLDSLVDLLLVGNYEVKHNAASLFEGQLDKMTDSRKAAYAELLKKKIIQAKESVNLMEELYSDLLGAKIE